MASADPCTSALTRIGSSADVFVFLRLLHQLFKGGRGTSGGAFVLGGLFAVGSDFARLCFGLGHVQNVTGLGRAVETQNLDRNRGAGFL